jgi:hypothetical protein
MFSYFLVQGPGKLHFGADPHPATAEWPGENLLLFLRLHGRTQVLLLPGFSTHRSHQDPRHFGLWLSRRFAGGRLHSIAIQYNKMLFTVYLLFVFIAVVIFSTVIHVFSFYQIISTKKNYSLERGASDVQKPNVSLF